MFQSHSRPAEKEELAPDQQGVSQRTLSHPRSVSWRGRHPRRKRWRRFLCPPRVTQATSKRPCIVGEWISLSPISQIENFLVRRSVPSYVHGKQKRTETRNQKTEETGSKATSATPRHRPGSDQRH